MLRSFPRLLLLLLACTVFLTACDVLPTRGQPDLVQTAERDYARGDYARAAHGFLEAADSQRNQRDLLRLRAAEAWREEGELGRAANALEGVSSRRFNADAQHRLSLLQAEILLSRGEAERALAMLDQPTALFAAHHRARLLELRARAAEASDNLFLAATARAELESSIPAQEQADNTRAIQALLARLDDNALSFGAASLPAAHALYPHAARALIARNLPLPRAYGDSPAATARTQADLDGYRPFSRIALLLPTQGPLSQAAQAVRDGFIAGYYQENRARPDVRIYSTGNSPETALAAYNSALRDGAQAIVGPLSRDDVAMLFETDRNGAIPLLALNRSGSAPPPPGSMSFALTPEDEGTAAANRITERGGQRVLVVHGSDDYGQRAIGALNQRLQQRGARVAATLHLPEGQQNFSAAISTALAQLNAERTAHGGSEVNYSSRPADAIFFAGRAEQARMLMPQLRVAGVSDIPIYATSQITAGSGDARLDRELDGIEFTEAPWLLADHLPGLPPREALASLDSTHGSSGRLFAFGLDAFRLISYFEHISHNPNTHLPGATGYLRHDGFGQILRSPGWAQFRGGRIQPARETGLLGDDIQFR